MNFRKFVKALIPTALFEKIAPTGHLIEANLAQFWYGFPAHNLNVIGITGTSGKTTTTTLMASILKAAGHKTAYFTTAERDFGDGPQFNDSRMTTVGAMTLNRDIKRAKDNGAEWLVLEVASHALVQHRVWGIPFKAAVITNLSHEHMDYHKTPEAYRAAKQKLFKLANHYGGIGVINLDDANADYFNGLASSTISYSRQKKADVMAKDIKTGANGSTFKVVSELAPDFSVETKLPGTFNISNVLAAVSTALALGLDPEQVSKGIANLPAVPGRMASYKTDAGFSAIVDFAHTPDAFEKIFKEVKPLTKGKLIAVFGCAGERDTARRYIQGQLAADYCDSVILTEDDPRSEDNRDIMSQIEEGMKKSRQHPELFKIDLREDAVDKAVSLASKGDIILLLSKGHERSIALANDKLKPWNEEEAFKKACKDHGIKVQ